MINSKTQKIIQWCERLDSEEGTISKYQQVWMYIRIYTVIFILTFCIVYSPMIFAGKSFVWASDGRTQLYPSMIYIGRSIRQFVFDCIQGNFAFPQFDLNMGLGGDIISFPASLGMLDPFVVLLSPLVMTKYGEYLYFFLSFFYLYLAGLSFSYLCFTFKKNKIYTLIGAVVYCFCGFAIIRVVKGLHFFTIGMVQLPLLIIGAYKITKNDKPWLFVLTVFWSAINKYYSLYMMAIMVAVFVLVILICDQEKDKTLMIKQISYCVGRIFLYALLGVCMAGIVIIPSLVGMLSSSRSNGLTFDSQSWTWYRDAFLRLFAKGVNDDIAIAALALPAHVCLVFSRKKRHKLKIIIGILTFCYFSSLVSWIFNGFQYTSKRWIFGAALGYTYVIVEMLPDLLCMSKRQMLACYIVTCCYTLFVFWNAFRGIGNYAFVGVIFLWLTLAVLSFIQYRDEQSLSMKKDSSKIIRLIVVLALVIFNVSTISAILFVPAQDNLLSEFRDFGFEGDRLEKATERYLEEYILSDPDGRADGTNFYRNTGMIWRIPTVLMSYNSVENRNVIDFWSAISLSTRNQVFNHYSTDHRTIPLTLLSNKYYVAQASSDINVPYGYVPIKTLKNGYVIFENENALPWGYTYDAMISYEELESLNALEKQEMMLQAIAVDSRVLTDTELPLSEKQKIPYNILYSGCTWENGILNVKSSNATITLEFDTLEGHEIYLVLNNFNLDNISSFNMTIKCNDKISNTAKTSNHYVWYRGIRDYYYNLGSKNEGLTTATITIQEKGEYELGSIDIFSTSFSNYSEQVNALRAEPLENIEIFTNHITGTVDLSKDKVLCVSVPYSKGWSAKVDGEKVEILRGNYMFMVLPLTAGHHEIDFNYCSPGSKFGAVITVVSVCIVIWMIVHDRKRNKQKAG